MENLKVLGKEHVGNYEFTGIEGGFGKDKKAMLVKDIASIHGKEIGYINRAIEMNKRRFKNGIDIIDVLNASDAFRNFAKENGLIGSNRTKHVYLLSERGYAKLLKILEDDKAWEIYDELVDNYFNMRRRTKRLDSDDKLKLERLEIMKENSKTRKGNLLYKLAMETQSKSAKESMIAKAAEVITGEKVVPIMQEKYYSATEVGKKLGLTANKVGRIAKQLGLKAEQPGQNKYGRWSNSKARSSSKEVPQWLYTKVGINAIKNA